jgi:hypothetical protein
MSHEDRMARAWQMARTGGTEGAADRLAVLHRREDHPLGITAEARP